MLYKNFYKVIIYYYILQLFRQKIMTCKPQILKYAIHLKIICPKKKKYYLYKNIRIVFVNRIPDEEQSLSISYDIPDKPKYFPYTPNSKKLMRYSLNNNDDEEEIIVKSGYHDKVIKEDSKEYTQRIISL